MKPKKRSASKPDQPKADEITAEDDAQAIARKLYDRLKQGMKVKVVIGIGKSDTKPPA
jgi:uncharacterized protein YdbL (DUF1318 family)